MVASAKASLGRNAVLNLAAYVTTVLVALLVTPLVIHHLGDAQYGAWSVVADLVAYSGLMDLGVRWAVSFYLIQHIARSEWGEVSEVLSSAVAVLIVIGAIVITVGATFAAIIPHAFKGIEPGQVGAVRTAILILSGVVGLAFPLEIYSSLLYANRRLDIQSGIEIMASLLAATGFYLVVRFDGGVVAMSMVQAGARVVGWVVRIAVARRLPVQYRIERRLVRAARIRQFLRFGSNTFTINISRLVLGRMQLLIIGTVAGVALVTRYRIGAALTDYTFQAVGAMAMAFTPHLAHLIASGETEALKALYLRATRLCGFVAAMLPAYVIVFGRHFIALWVGPEYVSGAATARSDLVLVVVLVGLVPRMLQSISWQMLLASGDVRYVMRVTVVESIANVALALLLVRPFGIVGVAFGAALPVFVTQTLIVPRYVLRRFAIDAGEYWRIGLARPAGIAMVALAASWGIVRVLPPTTWLLFVAEAGAAALIGATLVALVGLRPEDRAMIRERLAAFPLLASAAGR